MPIDLQTLLIFAPIALALNLTPGADMLFCLAQGIKGGPRAGWAASLGISTGSLIHVTLAGAGLAALIASHPVLFDLIRWAGAAYLIWLGWSAWRDGNRMPSASGAHTSARRTFRDGLLVNLTNPKVAIFVLALIPQFVDPTRPPFGQFMALGLVLVVGGTLINGIVGGFAGRIGGMLARQPALGTWISRATGAVFVGLAARLAFERR